jgi:arginyl-tRNA--protein-N-Asp/Glu arginylyltransferase
MKIFYSELTAFPAYYSFGYCVYGELEEGDNLADCYEQGFLPFVGARVQGERMMYQARGCRVRVAEWKEDHYYRQVLRKVGEFSKTKAETNKTNKEPQNGIQVLEYAKEDFPVTDEFVDFLLTYFKFRFGKESMPKDRLLALLASPLLTHIVEYRLDEKPIAYMLEVHTENSMHFWYQAYAKKFENRHLGAYLLLDLMQRAKAQGKKYVYLGVTYGNWMKYKTNFQPLEYWNGQEWVNDPKSKKLKELLKVDPLRVLGFTDQWRDERDPYYKAPYPFTSTFMEARFLTLLMTAVPRIFFGVILVVLVMMLVLASQIIFR